MNRQEWPSLEPRARSQANVVYQRVIVIEGMTRRDGIVCVLTAPTQSSMRASTHLLPNIFDCAKLGILQSMHHLPTRFVYRACRNRWQKALRLATSLLCVDRDLGNENRKTERKRETETETERRVHETERRQKTDSDGEPGPNTPLRDHVISACRSVSTCGRLQQESVDNPHTTSQAAAGGRTVTHWASQAFPGASFRYLQ